MSTLKVNSIEPANAGSEDYFLARAWVNFNGTGTVAIRASGNVSSITDNGTGQYTTNFTSPVSDANYSATLGNARVDSNANASGMGFSKVHTRATTSLQILTGDSATGNVDHVHVDVTVTR